MSQATRKAVERSLDLWLLLDHGTFWQEQKKNVTAKKALSNTQTALIGTASNLVPGTLDQVSNANLKEATSASNTLPKPTVTSQAPLSHPTSLLQPTAVEDQILSTDDLSSNSTDDATTAKSSAPALAVVEPADTSDEHADISDESEELLEREREELLRSKTDIADILAIIGVLAPHMPTSRMQEFFSADQLKAISRPESELPDIDVDDEMIMKAVR
ncbi:hypothetical protein BGZ76_005958, partial [Entomortierella beljakovae]